jgi:hypothetical protein
VRASKGIGDVEEFFGRHQRAAVTVVTVAERESPIFLFAKPTLNLYNFGDGVAREGHPFALAKCFNRRNLVFAVFLATLAIRNASLNLHSSCATLVFVRCLMFPKEVVAADSRLVAHYLSHAIAVALGLTMIVFGIAMGVTVVLLPVGLCAVAGGLFLILLAISPTPKALPR